MAQVPLTNEEALKICKEPEAATKDFVFQQTAYRVKDPRKSLAFYNGVMGMRLLQKYDFPDRKFSLYYLGFKDPSKFIGELGSVERCKWTFVQEATLELTHNWGTEDDPNFQYHVGNTEPRGYGHIGVLVPDLAEACERFERLGVKFAKRPEDGIMKDIAYITDPDGYWLEIFDGKMT